MPKKNDSWGIEVGSNAIKAIHLVRNGTQVNLVDYEIIPFKKILTTPDLDVDKAIEEHLGKLISKHNIGRSTVVLSVPGSKAFARFAKLPPVEAKKISSIVRFEAVQQIPFPIEQVEWDYQIFQQSNSTEVEVGIFAISKDRVQKFLSHFKQQNIPVDALTLSPVAAYNAFHFDDDGGSSDEGTIYMDIGTTSTDVVIVQSGKVWLRTLPIGGNNFTEALVKAFKLSYSKAERLKREASTSKYAKQIFQAMRSVFSDLAQEIQRSLGYYQSVNREADLTKVVGLGSTFRLPGLQKYLKQQLKLDVQCPDGFKKIFIEGPKEADFSDSALNLATAYGLAVQGLNLQSVSANLLPKDILTARMWHRKQPWAAAAAACLVVGAVFMGGRYYAASSAYNSSYEKNHGQVEAILREAQNFQSQWSELSQNSSPKERIKNLNSTLDYRGVTADIYNDISNVINKTSNPALLGMSRQQIDKLSASQRKRAYIDSVNIMYVPTNKAVSGSSGNNQQLLNFDLDNLQNYGMNQQPQEQTKSIKTGFFGKNFKLDTFWKKISGKDSSNDTSKKSQISAKQQLTERGPRLVVSIVGNTSYSDATQLLQDIVVSLNEIPGESNHPYKSVKAELSRLEVVNASNNNNNGSNRNGNYNRRDGQQSGNENEIRNTSDINQLIPGDQSSGIESDNKRFMLVWVVQLDEPGEVRSMMDSGNNKPVKKSARVSGENQADYVIKKEGS